MMLFGSEPRQTTANLGHLQKPSIQVMILLLRNNRIFGLILGFDSWIE